MIPWTTNNFFKKKHLPPSVGCYEVINISKKENECRYKTSYRMQALCVNICTSICHYFRLSEILALRSLPMVGVAATAPPADFRVVRG